MIQYTRVVHGMGEFFQFVCSIKSDDTYRNSKNKLLQIYESSSDSFYIQSLINTVKRELPDIILVGLTTSSGNSSSWSESSGTLCSFIFFEDSTFTVHHFDCKEDGPFSVGDIIGEELLRTENAKGALVFSAGLSLPISDFFTSVSSYESHIPFFGMMASVKDMSSNSATPYIFSDELYNYGIIVVIFKGENLHIKVGYNFGWKPFGKKMTVTEAHNSWVYKIDDAPATDIYRKYLGVLPNKYFRQNSADFPLVVDRKGVKVGRVGSTEVDGKSVVFSGDIYEGEKIQFSYGNLHDILMETLNDSISLSEFESQAILLFVCVSRSSFLKEDAERELSCYECVASNYSHGYGFAEFMLDENGGGGVLNTSLVSVGMREGELKHKDLLEALAQHRQLDQTDESEWENDNVVIPLAQRLVKFLEATTAELEQMAAAANAANKAKSEFLSSMSHEIRTPINAVLGLDEMIIRETKDANIKEYASNIQSSGKVLLSLINNVLDFSKIEAGKMEIIEADYDLSSMINDIMNMILPRAQKKNLELVVNIDPTMPYRLNGDENRIKQCVINILTNAVKYTNEGFIVLNIGWEKRDDVSIVMNISVSDTGIGMKAEDLPRLFSPFERMEEMRNRSIEGTGLGLNIVKKLLFLMDSQLDVKSEYGKGSEFSFSVSQKVLDWSAMGNFNERHKQNVERKEYQESFQAPSASILVVDDISVNLSVIKGLLKKTRIKIDTASSGKEFIEMACATKYDILFVDHQMPEMDGVEAFHLLKEKPDNACEHTPAIALTANAISGARENYIKAGFTDYLSKPVASEALEEMIIKYLPEEKTLHKGDAGFVDSKDVGQDPNSSVSIDLAAYFFKRFKIDINDALKFCGGMENFMSVAENFYEMIDEQAEKIKKFSEEQNVREYTVQVHALKNSARLIGAQDLSDRSLYLEKCGNEKNMDEINSLTPKLIKDYLAYKPLIGSLLGKEGVSEGEKEDTRAEISKNDLNDALSTLKSFVSAFDFNNADSVISMLEEYKMPMDFKDKYNKIKHLIKAVDHDALMEILETI
ncbi:MAG: response regulator [Treponema sp.]|nr:response regulator [Treponema sp.]